MIAWTSVISQNELLTCENNCASMLTGKILILLSDMVNTAWEKALTYVWSRNQERKHIFLFFLDSPEGHLLKKIWIELRWDKACPIFILVRALSANDTIFVFTASDEFVSIFNTSVASISSSVILENHSLELLLHRSQRHYLRPLGRLCRVEYWNTNIQLWLRQKSNGL